MSTRGRNVTQLQQSAEPSRVEQFINNKKLFTHKLIATAFTQTIILFIYLYRYFCMVNKQKGIVKYFSYLYITHTM